MLNTPHEPCSHIDSLDVHTRDTSDGGTIFHIDRYALFQLSFRSFKAITKSNQFAGLRLLPSRT